MQCDHKPMMRRHSIPLTPMTMTWNPTYNTPVSQYAPTNSPAISDLFDLFDF